MVNSEFISRLQLSGYWIVSVAARPGEDATGNVCVKVHSVLLRRKIPGDVLNQAIVDLKQNLISIFQDATNEHTRTLALIRRMQRTNSQ